MTESPIDPTSRQPIQPHGPTPGHFGKKVSDFEGKGPPYKTWAGMKFTKDQWTLFMKYLAQSTVNQIKRENARLIKASRKLKEEETR